MLVSAYRRTSWDAPGMVAPAARALPRHHHRRLLSEPPREAGIADYAQAVLLPPASAGEAGGSVVLPGLVPPGTELVSAASNVLPSMGDCFTACRQLKECNSLWYCETQGGCYNSNYNLSSPYGGCQLVFQELTRPGTGRPAVWADAPGFTGGAPIPHTGSPLAGYAMKPGLGYWYRYDYTCPDSVSQPGSCGLLGTPEMHAARCDADPACQVMMYFPDGRDYPGPGSPVTLLKGAQAAQLNVTTANINLNAVLYMKDAVLNGTAGAGGGGGSVLSDGAIAGVAVGAVCLAGLVAAAGILALRRRQAQKNSMTKALQASSSGGGTHSGGGELPAKGSGWTEEGLLPAPVGKHAEVLADSSSEARGQIPSGGEPQGPVRPFKDCPPTPPPTTLDSQSFYYQHYGPSSRTSDSHAGIPQPTQGPPLLTGASPRGAAPAFDPLLAHLPVEGWQRCVVDCEALQFTRAADGSYEELGAGAFATVYKVLLNGVEPHAAKVLRLGGDPMAKIYFLEEAGLLRRLRHKNIVGFAGVCVAGGNGIILMELMEEGDLRSRQSEVNSGGQRVFGWHQRGKTVALDVACALHYLHSNTYTHFDVKSRNVLLSRDHTAKLADVGFTRAMRATHHSIEGPAGTFDYMAPELLIGRQCTSSVDVYSFGVLLWEICVGKYPVRGSMRAPLVPQECPQTVAELLLQCMDEDPLKRPTARQLVERLTQLQKQ